MAVSCRAVGSTVSARLHGVKHFLSIKRNLDSALKIYEVLAARHLYVFKVLAARKTYLITARARKNKRTARMLASARKDHTIPLRMAGTNLVVIKKECDVKFNFLPS